VEKTFPKRCRANYGYAAEQALVLLTTFATFAGRGPEACVPSWPTSPRTKLYNGRDTFFDGRHG